MEERANVIGGRGGSEGGPTEARADTSSKSGSGTRSGQDDGSRALGGGGGGGDGASFRNVTEAKVALDVVHKLLQAGDVETAAVGITNCGQTLWSMEDLDRQPIPDLIYLFITTIEITCLCRLSV